MVQSDDSCECLQACVDYAAMHTHVMQLGTNNELGAVAMHLNNMV